MRNIKICLAAAALVVGANVSAFAADGTVEFNGTAAGACSFAAAQPGSIEVDGTLKKWTTKTPATIEIMQTGGADSNVTLSNLSTWKSSPAGAPSTTFTLTPSISSGANSSQLFDSVNKVLLPTAGVDTISVEMTAESATPFAAGSYNAEVTLTCSVGN